MQVKGWVVENLGKALREAFSPPQRFDQFLMFSLDRNRHEISMAPDYVGITYDVILAAQAEGWLVDLVAAARLARPANPAFVQAAREVGLTTGRSDLERILNTSLPE